MADNGNSKKRVCEFESCPPTKRHRASTHSPSTPQIGSRFVIPSGTFGTVSRVIFGENNKICMVQSLQQKHHRIKVFSRNQLIWQRLLSEENAKIVFSETMNSVYFVTEKNIQIFSNLDSDQAHSTVIPINSQSNQLQFQYGNKVKMANLWKAWLYIITKRGKLHKIRAPQFASDSVVAYDWTLPDNQVDAVFCMRAQYVLMRSERCVYLVNVRSSIFHRVAIPNPHRVIDARLGDNLSCVLQTDDQLLWNRLVPKAETATLVSLCMNTSLISPGSLHVLDSILTISYTYDAANGDDRMKLDAVSDHHLMCHTASRLYLWRAISAELAEKALSRTSMIVSENVPTAVCREIAQFASSLFQQLIVCFEDGKIEAVDENHQYILVIFEDASTTDINHLTWSYHIDDVISRCPNGTEFVQEVTINRPIL